MLRVHVCGESNTCPHVVLIFLAATTAPAAHTGRPMAEGGQALIRRHRVIETVDGFFERVKDRGDFPLDIPAGTLRYRTFGTVVCRRYTGIVFKLDLTSCTDEIHDLDQGFLFYLRARAFR